MSRFYLILLTIGLSTSVPAIEAAPFTWDANGIFVDGNQDGAGTWSTANANWNNGAAIVGWPNSGTLNDTAVFGVGNGAAGTVLVSGAVNVNSINFNAPGSGNYTIGGTALNLNGTTPTINVVAGLSPTISAVLTGSSLTKTGTGTLTLSGANTYGDGTTVDAGKLKLDLTSRSNNSALNLGSITTNVNGTLELHTNAAPSYGATALTSSGTVFTGTGTIVKTGTGILDWWSTSAAATTSIKNFAGLIDIQQGVLANQTTNDWSVSAGNMSLNIASGAIFDLRTSSAVINNLTGTGTIGSSFSAGMVLTVGAQNGSSTFDGVIQNTVPLFANAPTVGLVKAGTGTLTLTGANSYTGATTVTGGTLEIDQVGFGSSNGNVGGRQLTTSSLNVSTNALVILDTGGNFSSANSGTTLTGAGTIRLASGKWWMGGPSAGTTVSMSAGGLIEVMSGATLSGDFANANWTANQGSLHVAAGGNFDLRNNNATIDVLTGGGNVYDAGFTNTLTIGVANGSGTFSGLLGTGGTTVNLVKNGTGTQTFSGANTYTGTTTINAGTLQAGASTTVFGNNSAVTLANAAGATLDLNNFNVAIGSLAGGGPLGGNVTLGTGTLTVGGNNATTNFAGVISGTTGGLIKTGTGTLTLSGAMSNTYTGDTTLSGTGQLVLSKTGGAVAINGNMIMAASGLRSILSATQDNQFGPNTVMSFPSAAGRDTRFELKGTTQTLAGLDSVGFAGTYAAIQHNEFSPNAAVDATSHLILDVTGSNSYSFGNAASTAVIRNYNGGVLSLTKQGTGTQTLLGNGITYTGQTTVTGGRLVFSSTGALNTSINNSATVEINSVTGDDWTLNNNVLSGAGIWIKTGGGRATFANTTLNTSGQFFIQAGTLRNNNNSTNWSGSTADIDISSGAILDLYADAVYVDQLTGTGFVQNNYGNPSGQSGSATYFEKLVVGVAGGSATFAGVIRNNVNGTAVGAGTGPGGGIQLEKIGAGTQNLSGANTYTGQTIVNAGTLEIDGSINNSREIVINRTAGALNNTNGRLLIDAAGTRTLGNTLFGTGDVIAGDNNFGYLQHGASSGTTLATSNIGRDLVVGRAVGGVGLVDVNDGSILNVGRSLLIGNNAGTGTVNVNAGGTLNVNGNTTIIDSPVAPDYGTLNIAGTYTEDGDLIVGQNATGIVNQIGGSASINHNADATGNLILGQTAAGSLGTYNLWDGTLHVRGSNNTTAGAGFGNTNVGVAGRGIVNHSGGTFYNDTDMTIGGAVAGSQYNLSDTGTLNFRDRAGGTQVAATDNAISTLTIGANGDFNFAGGTLMNVTNIDVTSAPGAVFTQDGGRFVLGVDGGLDPNDPLTQRAMTTISGGDFNQTGGRLVVDIFGKLTRTTGTNEFEGYTGPQADPIDSLITDSDLLFIADGRAFLDGTLEIDLNDVDLNAFAWYDVVVADEVIVGSNFAVDGILWWRVIQDPSDPTRNILQVAVPEPASIAGWCLLAIALGSVVVLRRRKHASR